MPPCLIAHTQISPVSARDLIARDLDRAAKLVIGINPHGPKHHHKANKRAYLFCDDDYKGSWEEFNQHAVKHVEGELHNLEVALGGIAVTPHHRRETLWSPHSLTTIGVHNKTALSHYEAHESKLKYEHEPLTRKTSGDSEADPKQKYVEEKPAVIPPAVITNTHKQAVNAVIEEIKGGQEAAHEVTGVDVSDAGVIYTAKVGFGEPSKYYDLLVDSGSSVTWVGGISGRPDFVPSPSCKETGNRIAVGYGKGTFIGSEHTDTVTLSPELVIKNQSIGVGSTIFGFEHLTIDGILGIGPVGLTRGSAGGDRELPTVTDTLFAQHTIKQHLIGIHFEPPSEGKTVTGKLSFGSVDESQITGEVKYVPITTAEKASRYWGIDQSVTYGQETLLKPTAGIVDTGTTFLMMASDMFDAYREVTGAVMDDTTSLLTVTEEQYEKLQPLCFHIGGEKYELTPNAQIWPREFNHIIKGEKDKIYLVAVSLPTKSGAGIDIINGFVFLQRFYSVFDTGNSRVGLAATPFTYATTN
ncbi:aspartic peptidase domain-containing protein [Abortiporus biennis]|nr:aspartic peptidase domain-containing protein [Abortiporus biennis]